MATVTFQEHIVDHSSIRPQIAPRGPDELGRERWRRLQKCQLNFRVSNRFEILVPVLRFTLRPWSNKPLPSTFPWNRQESKIKNLQNIALTCLLLHLISAQALPSFCMDRLGESDLRTYPEVQLINTLTSPQRCINSASCGSVATEFRGIQQMNLCSVGPHERRLPVLPCLLPRLSCLSSPIVRHPLRFMQRWGRVKAQIKIRTTHWAYRAD